MNGASEDEIRTWFGDGTSWAGVTLLKLSNLAGSFARFMDEGENDAFEKEVEKGERDSRGRDYVGFVGFVGCIMTKVCACVLNRDLSHLFIH